MNSCIAAALYDAALFLLRVRADVLAWDDPSGSLEGFQTGTMQRERPTNRAVKFMLEQRWLINGPTQIGLTRLLLMPVHRASELAAIHNYARGSVPDCPHAQANAKRCVDNLHQNALGSATQWRQNVATTFRLTPRSYT